MRYWLDTEFIENGKTIDLISIGIVAEDGREYYGINAECKTELASDWVKNNVLPWVFTVRLEVPKSRREIAADIIAFCCPEQYGKPQLWGYYADYDWVALCQLFGTMMDLPKGWPMYCRDIKQWCDEVGNPQLPMQGEGEHNALADARWNKRAWAFLKTYTTETPAAKNSDV